MFTEQELRTHFKSYEHEVCGEDCKAIAYLLKRLEAAEKVCYYAQRWLVNLNPSTDIDIPLIEWRKAAGK